MTTAVTYRAAPVLEIDAETVSLPVAAGDAPSSLITLGNEIKDTTKDVQRTDDLWITPEEAAQFMGIHVRNARRALAAREWRGHALVVREIHGQRARGGKALQVHVDSLPEAQRAAWWSARGVDIHSRPDPEVTALIEAGPGHDPAWKAKVEEARWKLSIIEPLMRLDRIKRAAAVATSSQLIAWG